MAKRTLYCRYCKAEEEHQDYNDMVVHCHEDHQGGFFYVILEPAPEKKDRPLPFGGNK